MKALILTLLLAVASNSAFAIVCQETGDYCNDYLDCCMGSCVANVCVSSFVDFGFDADNKRACVVADSQCQDGSICCSNLCENGVCL